MNHRFELALYLDHNGQTILTLAECLRRHAAGQTQPAPLLDDTTLILESAGRDWMASRWVLGELDSLRLQFEAAAERLERGEEAIVRSAVDDRSIVAYFLFEPRADQHVYITIFFIENQLRYNYPVYNPEAARALYDYVRENRERLLRRPESIAEEVDIRQVPYPRDELVANIRRETALARHLLELQGAPSES